MAKLSVRVSTGEAIGAGTWNKIAVSIVGARGETPPLRLDHPGKEFSAGASVGSLSLLVDNLPAPPSSWKTYRPGWPHCLDEKSVKDLDLNIKYSVMKNSCFYLKFSSAFTELKLKGLLDRKGLWKSLNEMRRMLNFRKTPAAGRQEDGWAGDSDLLLGERQWLKPRLRKEDAFFASQFLNGLNPVLIHRCRHLPENFPITDDMVAPVLGPGTSLQAELERGSLFLVDHGILSGIHTNVVNGRPQFSAAPMTLLFQRPGGGSPAAPCHPGQRQGRGREGFGGGAPQTPHSHLSPHRLLLQLSQTPGPDSPIFLPGDNKRDWLLAKTWVRNAEFSVHEAVTHLLHAHLLPHCHPLFKLLIPHTRYILHINTLARELFIAPGQVVDRSTGIGVGGFSELIQRNMEQLSYSVLCLPEDIQARGVEDIPNYYYRDDGLQIWGAVEREGGSGSKVGTEPSAPCSFVSEIINIYYPSDASVHDDHELQAWVWEIFSEGFLGRESSGVPSALETREALVQYVTMVIFNCSAKHYAVSAGQFDSCVWMPNLPPTMQLPPHTCKGQTTPEGFLATLPLVNATCDIIIALWLLSKEPGDQRPLGTYPEEHFTEEAPQQSITAFQSRLAQILKDIRERNQRLSLPYTYLDPPLIENSISI
ncbi:hypothetical protein GH733_018692 [Mirounga leonina]|nr:hypothetical protein GH733_018692 [Mirounga leonina]